MQRPNRMAFLCDSIALPDASLGRVTLFPLNGTSVRTAVVSTAHAPGFYGVDPVAYGRSALVMTGWNVPGSVASSGTANDVALFLRRHGSTRLDTLARLTRGDIRMNVPALLRGQQTNMPREQPFVVTPTWDFAREGGGVVVLDTAGPSANAVTLRIRQWSNDGRLARTCTDVAISPSCHAVGISISIRLSGRRNARL